MTSTALLADSTSEKPQNRDIPDGLMVEDQQATFTKPA